MKRVALIVIMALWGCANKEATPNYDVLPRSPPDGWGQMRFVHAEADMNPVDVYTRDVSDPLLTDLSYGNAQGFVEIEAQDYTIDLRPAGESLDAEPTFSQDTTLGSGQRVTFILTDIGGTTQFLTLTDDLSRVDEGAMRVINVSNGALSLDFAADGTTELAGLASGDTARATTPDTASTTVTITGDSGAQTYALPERPTIGDVLIIVDDQSAWMLTYSFTMDPLTAP